MATSCNLYFMKLFYNLKNIFCFEFLELYLFPQSKRLSSKFVYLDIDKICLKVDDLSYQMHKSICLYIIRLRSKIIVGNLIDCRFFSIYDSFLFLLKFFKHISIHLYITFIVQPQKLIKKWWICNKSLYSRVRQRPSQNLRNTRLQLFQKKSGRFFHKS